MIAFIIQLACAFLYQISFAIFVGVALAAPVMCLWNAILPQVFGFQCITFLQAAGLSCLGNLLFGARGIDTVRITEVKR